MEKEKVHRMKLDKPTMHKIEWLIVFTALVIVCFFRFDLVVRVVRALARLLTPFALGGAMAFGINLLMRFLERKIFGKDFAYIRDIGNFSKIVGRYLKKQLEENG